ncbi:polymorphic toxin-type HINT domain-containing protein [Streptomyces sp. NPDC054841]
MSRIRRRLLRTTSRLPRTEARLFGLRKAQSGQTALEYLGLVMVVVAIVGALVATGIGQELTEKISAQVCRIGGGGDCGDGGGGDTQAQDGDDSPGEDTGGGTDGGNTGGNTGGDTNPINDEGGANDEDVHVEDEQPLPDDPNAPKSQEQIDYEKALKELQDAQAAEKSDSDKAKEAAKELGKILAEELGITDALKCITEGDMGACTETLINVLLSLIGGAVGKLAAKYGAPWKWKKAYELIKKLKKHGGDLYDGLKSLIKNRKKVKQAEDKLADTKKKLDAKKQKKPDDKPTACAVKHSFLPGTPVLLADGRSIPIETVRTGDRVRATDPYSGVTATRRVTDTITTYDDKHFTRLTVRTGSGTALLTATDTHPFWVQGQERWVDAGEIRAGDELRDADGAAVTVLAARKFTQRRTTHDLTVAGIHTYYVFAGDSPVLVHNIDQSRYKYMDRPGYSNYVLVDKNGKVYYSGMFGGKQTKADVERRHGNNNNRFNPKNGDKMIVTPGKRTYGEARILEQANADKYKTVIGKKGTDYRGNRQEPMDPKKRAEYADYEKQKKLGGCP